MISLLQRARVSVARRRGAFLRSCNTDFHAISDSYRLRAPMLIFLINSQSVRPSVRLSVSTRLFVRSFAGRFNLCNWVANYG